jgi:hypothetical protein
VGVGGAGEGAVGGVENARAAAQKSIDLVRRERRRSIRWRGSPWVGFTTGDARRLGRGEGVHRVARFAGMADERGLCSLVGGETAASRGIQWLMRNTPFGCIG